MGFGNRNGALVIAEMMGLAARGVGFTATREHLEPDNRGRRAEKSAERLAKAEEKRKRRAAKRLGA